MTFQSKDEALDYLEAARAEWLAEARAWARTFAADGRAITINDVRAGGPPVPDDVDPRVCGAVFRTDEWVNIGYTRSARKLSHGRPVARFRLAEFHGEAKDDDDGRSHEK